MEKFNDAGDKLLNVVAEEERTVLRDSLQSLAVRQQVLACLHLAARQ